MQHPENGRQPLHPDKKEFWRKAWIALVEDRREYAELAEEIMRSRPELQDTTIHQFRSCESFMNAENLDDYDVCFMDGDFGQGKTRGFEAVPFIRARKPNMVIIGITDHEDYLEAFQEVETDFALRKHELLKALPQILQLAPLQEE